ncbi:myb-like protein AA [Drosophila rhopaloa]|uniref:Myb-like protein AA n=1 Tax=Drosophila rhopaloa TaxID=1041015 RepID=A0A6P4E0U4_DRORH|nr:myb-like protein AA [Drosophila rhopaloa]XP_044314276.1 myb-like protein AA [Drosophila rhopaloa]XP_044314277.1 myb-like protein AA [Drosophila rhopaloa]XP_044314278.1 myb-like protein AA [Drosophila rhopaloa]XP_044314279.1 myb-like protein AA [Drosophila rhopaloa]
MAFSRHNIEKRRLIELVRLNPILWDCRLPHYKRSDKRKAIKWNELGRLFNVNGERVQRTFTSLREIFRRELNHEKMLGTTRFKSKWEYYDAMAFLKEVIRERKSRERIKHGSLDSAPAPTGSSNNNNSTNNVSRNSSNNNSSSAALDEYQYFAPSDPNNPNNQPQPQPAPKSSVPAVAIPSLSLNLSQLPAALQQQAQHLQALQLQPDVTLTSLQKQPSLSLPATTPLSHISPAQLLSSSRSCSSSPSIYIKDEPGSPEVRCQDEGLPGNGREGTRKKLATIRPQTKEQLKARLQLPAPKNTSAYATSPPHLIINANNELIDADAGDLEEDLDDFDEDDDVAGNCLPVVDQSDMIGVDDRLSAGSSYTGEGGGCGRGLGRSHSQARHMPTSRELLYMKFGDFLAARLNTLHETVANELMNKMLLLIAEK